MPVARKVWQPIGAGMPAAAARRRIIRQASGWLIGLADSVAPLWPRAVRNSQPFRSSAMPAAWRNLVPPKAMPYVNPLGLVYDSGDYPASLRRAAELGDWTGFAVRRAEARRRGRCRGIGVAMSIELNTGAPRERAELTIDPSGTVELVLGTMSAGQGHETSFAQVIAEWLGAEPERVRLVTGDTDRVQAGGGSASARSMRLGSWVIAKAADAIIDRGRHIAGAMLETAA